MCFMMLDGGGKLFNGLLYIPAIYFVFTELMRKDYIVVGPWEHWILFIDSW